MWRRVDSVDGRRAAWESKRSHAAPGAHFDERQPRAARAAVPAHGRPRSPTHRRRRDGPPGAGRPIRVEGARLPLSGARHSPARHLRRRCLVPRACRRRFSFNGRRGASPFRAHRPIPRRFSRFHADSVGFQLVYSTGPDLKTRITRRDRSIKGPVLRTRRKRTTTARREARIAFQRLFSLARQPPPCPD